MDLEQIKNEFNKYVSRFDTTDKDINYKIRHSYRVMNLSEELAKKLNLTEEEIKLATTIGLLHDIGRFKQLEDYNSYSDINVDHGDLGVELLFENNLIKNFNISKKYYDIISFSIKNHNKLKLEKDNDKNKILFAKIIRDTDKIDILKAFSIYKDFKLNYDNEEISKEVREAFLNKQEILKLYLKNKNDIVVLRLGFLHDINFDESLKIIYKDKIIECFENLVDNNEILKPYMEHSKQYIRERIR